MPTTRLLSRGEFDCTFTTRMAEIEPSARSPVDFWPYFKSIPCADFQGFDCTEGRVDRVYQSAGGRYQHVLVRGLEKDVFMIIVLNARDRVVHGHRLLSPRN